MSIATLNNISEETFIGRLRQFSKRIKAHLRKGSLQHKMAAPFGLLLVLSLLAFVTAENGPCPPADHLRPCQCSFTGVDVILRCDGLKRQSDLDSVLHRTNGQHFDRLNLVNSKLGSLPGRSLETKQFDYLSIIKSSMLSLFYHRPSEHNQLETLSLEEVDFKNSLDWNLFKNLNQLKKLHIRDVNVPELNDKFRDNVSNTLTSIDLKRTNTSMLVDGVFANMPDLKYVRIVKNSIKELNRTMFSNNSKLETLLFDDNEIDFLPDDLFKDMPQLLRIGLRNNNISQISASVFGQAYINLLALILEGNPINCDCSMKWFAFQDHTNKYVTGSCSAPQNLAGKEITDLTIDHFIDCV